VLAAVGAGWLFGVSLSLVIAFPVRVASRYRH
jgi:hypothetical protein